ncbi:carboxymuconolactone decarboxylase family protein [Amycolatopsis japonica]|uniref:carboxymuconolactone decarboxylase family protein n=1 Tax=Amycolatopsis japonica TaxID=208439 RepID=UPI00366ADEF0
MPRIPQLTEHPSLTDVRAQLGRVPNLYAAMANGPAALSGYLALRDALTRGELTARERELLALFTAQRNECGYCLAAHTFRGEKMRIPAEELDKAREAESPDPHTRAVLRLADAVMAHRGRVPDERLAEARADGVTDAQVAEVVAHIALNVLSNYFNHVAEPDLDFPEVSR